MSENEKPSTPPKRNNLIVGIVFFIIAFALSVPWGMLIEKLKQTNSQLSDSPLVRLVPFFLMLVVYGVWKAKVEKRAGK